MNAVETCASCGAALEPRAPRCLYCATPTSFGIAEAEAAREREAALARTSQERATAAVNADAKRALGWSIASVPLCCMVLPQALAALFAMRALRGARRMNAPMPTAALTALGIALVTFAAFAATAAAYVSESRALDARRAQVHARAARGAAAAVLDPEAACALAEEKLVTDGFDGRDPIVLGPVSCDGVLTQENGRAALPDVHIVVSTDKRTATACFHRGARWLVDTLDARGECSAPAPAPRAP